MNREVTQSPSGAGVASMLTEIRQTARRLFASPGYSLGAALRNELEERPACGK